MSKSKIKKLTFFAHNIHNNKDNYSRPNDNSVVIRNGQPFALLITDWTEEATEADKKKRVKWTMVNPEGYIVDYTTHITLPGNPNNPNTYYRATLPAKYGNVFMATCWNVHVYLEDEVFGPHNFTGKIYPVSPHSITNIDLFCANRKLPKDTVLPATAFFTLIIETTGLYESDCFIRIVPARKKASDKPGTPVYRKKVKTKFGVLELRNIPAYEVMKSGELKFEVIIQAFNPIPKEERKELKEALIDVPMERFFLQFSRKRDLELFGSMEEQMVLTTIQDVMPDSIKEFDSCKFSKIEATVGNREKHVLFDENALVSRKGFKGKLKSGDTSYYFAFDKADLTSEAKETLDGLAKIIQIKDLEVIIDGHTDNRGSDEYNLILGEKRAFAVAEYLMEKGVKEKQLKLRSYGEHKPAIEDARMEEEHQQNRVVHVRMTLSQLVIPTVVYELTANNQESPELVTIDITDFTLKNCTQKDGHQHQKTLFIDHVTGNNSNSVTVADSKNTGQSVEKKYAKIHAPEFYFENFSKLSELIFMDKNNPDWASYYHQYRLRLNSCAYFPDPDNDLAEIRVYPDSRILFHAMMDYGQPKYRLNNYAGIELTPGITFSSDTVEKWLKGSDVVNEYILPYIGLEDLVKAFFEIANDMVSGYQFGIHTLYNFEDREMVKYRGIKDHTGKYATFFEIISWIGVAVAIIIEVLLIVLTRGKMANAKLKKYADGIRKIEEKITSKIPNSSLVSQGLDVELLKAFIGSEIFFNDQDPHNVALNYRFKADLDPIIGLKFEFGLLEMPGGKGDDSTVKGKLTNSIVDWLYDALGEVAKETVGINFAIKINGKLTSGIDINFQYLLRQMTWKEVDELKTGNIANHDIGSRLSIDIEAKIDGVKIVKLFLCPASLFGIPLIEKIQKEYLPDMEANIIIAFSSSIALITRYKPYKGGPCVEIVAVMFPMMGGVDVNINLGRNKRENEIEEFLVQDNSQKLPPQDRVILEGEEYVLFRISLMELFAGGLLQAPFESNKNKTR